MFYVSVSKMWKGFICYISAPKLPALRIHLKESYVASELLKRVYILYFCPQNVERVYSKYTASRHDIKVVNLDLKWVLN